MHPRTRNDFTIAILCALPIESEAVEALFDETYGRLGKSYGKAAGDPNAYANGRIGKHNIVLCYLPGMGKNSAASVAAGLRASYLRIELLLLVGICGGAPSSATRDIHLGDVIISDSVLDYGFGGLCPNECERKSHVDDSRERMDKQIRALLSNIRGSQSRGEFGDGVLKCLDILKRDEAKWCHPGVADILFKTSHLHSQRIVRQRDAAKASRPSIHVGAFGSGDAVLKSAQHRDEVVRRAGVIGFEMEGAGVWKNHYPCVIIKGVCDYADSHKSKEWQAYAAATGASAAKTFLGYWERENGQYARLL